MGLINAVKDDELHKITVVCHACNKAVPMSICRCKIIKAEEFDSYLFYCYNCKNLIAFDFDYKDGTTKEASQAAIEDL